MDYKYENDRTLRISLTFADLEEHEIRLVDFLSEQEKVEELFFELVDELDLSDRWDDPEVMTFQIRPHAKGIDLLVTDDFNGIDDVPYGEMSAQLEDFLREVSGDPTFVLPPRTSDEEKGSSDNEVREKEQGQGQEKQIQSIGKDEEQASDIKPEFIYYTIKFDDFTSIINLAKTVSADIDESELYMFKDEYFLTVLDNQKIKGKQKTMILRALMLEYGEQGFINRELLREHAEILLDHDALKTLEKI